MMENRRIVYVTLLFLLAIVLILAGVLGYQNRQDISVVFLDVGQGDATLISSGSVQVLVDGGADGKKLLAKIGRQIPFWDRKIETVIATHPDADHIGGLIDVLGAYQIGAFIATDARSDSQVFSVLQEKIADKKITTVEARQGISLSFPGKQRLDLVFPFGPVADPSSKETNSSSVVGRLLAGQSRILLTGDLPSEQEKEIISAGVLIQADILKVAHHGSKYSTSEDFLRAVSPREAVISVGRNNRYGHPAPEILARLREGGIRVFRTDEAGDIRYDCAKDGDCQRVAD